MQYAEFLESKKIVDVPTGLDKIPELNPMLFQFQQDIVRWALRRGRSAIFADCGLGKSPMQLEWAKHVPGKVLILAPLAVSQQTIREAGKFNIGGISYCRNQKDIKDRITITNYEMLDNFDPDYFDGIVLDESSILKAFDGKTRNQIITSFDKCQFKLACTATPAPNDYMELGNHSEFLGVMKYHEMLSMFFVHDGGDTQKWRLKGHAEDDFWRWMASWAVALRRPSDLGYKDEGFDLPELIYHEITIKVDQPSDGWLFPVEAETLQERIQARRDTVEDRVNDCTKIVNETDDSFLIWCNLNQESDMLKKSINNAVEVKGSDSIEHKEKSMLGFAQGEISRLVSKPLICGLGMNFQNCHNMAFVGLSDSFEQFYQAVRRCWRFGQKHPVNVYIIAAETEGNVVANIKRKERDSVKMFDNMIGHMKDLNKKELTGQRREKVEYKVKKETGEGWELTLGDCVEVVSGIEIEKLDYSIYSPPFASLYTYTNSDRDMGNCKDNDEFMEHYRFLIREIYRATKPGRLTSFHCMNLPTSKAHNGYIGIRDFRGELIRAHEAEGWIYHSEVCIWKDPVTAMQRTKALGLLHKQLKKDSCMSRQGIPDYLVTMRKPGENPDRVGHTDQDFPVSEWQKIASPVWMDINPSDTLQFRSARDHKDDKHICPLQLEVIRRGMRMWSNPGDLVLSPFTGIGSEGYVALQMGRRFVGAELKESYFNQAVKNLNQAKIDMGELDLTA